MSSRVPSYIRRHRRAWGLTQRETALLLGLADRERVSMIERDVHLPNLDTLIALEVLFSRTTRMLFSARYDDIEARVLANARRVVDDLQGDASRRAIRVRELLLLLLSRAVNRSTGLDHGA